MWPAENARVVQALDPRRHPLVNAVSVLECVKRHAVVFRKQLKAPEGGIRLESLSLFKTWRLETPESSQNPHQIS
jgi:hypothetical protein